MAKCVLIVDDDRLNIELNKRLLQTKGYEVISAADGLEAWDAMQKKVPDIILLDVQMPNMDGYSFVLKKKDDPLLSSIPVIVISAQGKTEPLFNSRGQRLSRKTY